MTKYAVPAGMKWCWRCKAAVARDLFGVDRSRSDGLAASCRPCNSAINKQSRERHPETGRRVIERLRADPVRLAAQRRWQALRIRALRAAGLVPRGYPTRPVKYNPLKGRARARVPDAIRRGLLTRPETCGRCGATGRIHAHHADYTKPLDVEWLCTKCHGAEHRKYKDEPVVEVLA